MTMFLALFPDLECNTRTAVLSNFRGGLHWTKKSYKKFKVCFYKIQFFKP